MFQASLAEYASLLTSEETLTTFTNVETKFRACGLIHVVI